MEPLSNIRHTCSSCSVRPDPYWAEKPDEFFIGKYVKLGFEAQGGPEKEHMWVEVTGTRTRQGDVCLVGVLNNDPVYCPNLHDGMRVEFTKDEIEAVYDGTSFVTKGDP